MCVWLQRLLLLVGIIQARGLRRCTHLCTACAPFLFPVHRSFFSLTWLWLLPWCPEACSSSPLRFTQQGGAGCERGGCSQQHRSAPWWLMPGLGVSMRSAGEALVQQVALPGMRRSLAYSLLHKLSKLLK